MERKSKLNKIILTCDLISEEKLSIQDNLEHILDQVLKQVANLKSNQEQMKQKDISAIHRYTVDVLKHLCEVNSALEILIEDTPIQVLKVERDNSKSMETRKELPIHLEPVPPRLCSTTVFGSSTPVESTSELYAENTPLTSIVSELPEVHTLSESDKVENDIQTLKKSLSEFNEKFGLNKQNYSDMKDYYGKASTSSQAALKESLLLPDTCLNHEYSEGNFELPEKDTNTTQDCKQEPVDELNTTSSSGVSVNYSVKCEYLESSTPLLSASETISEDSSCADLDVSNNVMPDKAQELNNSNYTALEKLNNFRVNETDKHENFTAPDMKLQPSGIVIQNSISAKDKQSKKKEKKKNEDQRIYDVKLKETPVVGEECVFSHIESPCEFYIHINDVTTLAIDEITQQLNRICSNKENIYHTKEEAMSNLGKFCFGFIEKYKSWYRVQVVDYFMNEKHDSVLVQLIDYGNKALTSFTNLRRMTKEFSEIPILAIRCHLPLLFPKGSSHLNRLMEWPLSTIEAMVNHSGMDTNYVDGELQFFKIAYAEREGNNSVAIDLYRTNLPPEETIGQILLDANMAVQLLNDYNVQE